jgi:hypothetical protein
MSRDDWPIQPGAFAEPTSRAKRLAEEIASVLNDEDVSDVMIAIAMLTCSVVNHYARDAAGADEFIGKIRGLEDQLLAKTILGADLTLQ